MYAEGNQTNKFILHVVIMKNFILANVHNRLRQKDNF